MTPLLVRILFVLLIAFSLAPASVVHATHLGDGVTDDSPATTLENPLGAGTNLNTLISDILQIVVQIGSVVVILMLVYIGFLFVTAHGEPGKITEARSALMWTVVGALILLGAEAIAIGIQSTVQALSEGH